jgi:AcrR family transcriptional regulator
VGRPAHDVYLRRYELYVKAAPVFQTFGYRQVTMKALAHACGVTAPALYRYFPSKLDFALFPIAVPPTGACRAMLVEAAEQHRDPLRGLRAALEVAVADVGYVVLAVRLALEVGRDEREVFSTRDLEGFEAGLADVMRRCVPRLEHRASDLAHSLVSLIVTAAATNADLAPERLWRLGAPILRAYLIDAGVPEERLVEVFGRVW